MNNTYSIHTGEGGELTAGCGEEIVWGIAQGYADSLGQSVFVSRSDLSDLDPDDDEDIGVEVSPEIAGGKKQVNEKGLTEIKEFLAAKHKLGGDHFDRAMLCAWAQDVEFQLGEGNPASIEIRSFDAVSGHAETFTISDAGLDQ